MLNPLQMSTKMWRIQRLRLQLQALVQEVKIFNRLILPALKTALAKGELNYLPSAMGQIIETAHKAGSAPGQPPSFLFRFHSRPVLYALLRNKFDVLDALNKANKEANPSIAERIKNGDYREIRMGCDLTALNRSILTFLHKQDDIKFAKVSGDKLIFQLHAEPNRWRPVLNPYSSSIAGLSQPPTDVHRYVTSIFSHTPPYLQEQRSKQNQQLTSGEDDDVAITEPNQDDNPQLDNNRDFSQSSGFLSNHIKNKSRLSKAVSSIKKNFAEELSLFSSQLHAIKEAQVVSMATTAGILEDLTAAIAIDTKQTDTSGSESDDNSMDTASVPSNVCEVSRRDNITTSEDVPAAVAATVAASEVPTPAAATDDAEADRTRDRSASVKRPYSSPQKQRSNKKPRKSGRNRRQ